LLAGAPPEPRKSAARGNARPVNCTRILKLGFRQTGEQWDEVDGLELVYELG